jgi:hypothetical protein
MRYVLSRYREELHRVVTLYYASSEWDTVRREVRERDGDVCRECGKDAPDGICHHSEYLHWGKGNYEEIRSCLWVCGRCHRKVDHSGVPFFMKRSFPDDLYAIQSLKDPVLNCIE